MGTNYADLNNRVRTAITNRLVNEPGLQPSADLPEISKDLTEVVFGALAAGGFTEQLIGEKLGRATLTAAKRGSA